jgi:gamma-glutamyltranspeptidase/glutathione hydrolase
MHAPFRMFLCAASAIVAASVRGEEPPAAPESLARGMVAAAHPLAAEVGARILREGGNAIDAAVATAFALNVVEPDACGIGGGGFILFNVPGTDTVRAIDCRERAPAGLVPSTYEVDGAPREMALQYGGLSVGVPGYTHGLLTLHRLYGERRLEDLLDPAIRLAEDGFSTTEKFHALLRKNAERVRDNAAAAAVFLGGGPDVPPAGTRLVQREQAETLGAIRRLGLKAIYGQRPAGRISDAVRAAGGVMTAADLTDYRPIFRDPVSGRYRGYDIWTMGPPSRGGIVLLQTLRILEAFDLAALGPEHPLYLALLIEALEISTLSAAAHVADPGTVEIDLAHLLSDAWAEEARGRMALPARLEGRPAGPAGVPPGGAPASVEPAAATPGDAGSTTHLSVVDSKGQFVAMTLTLNYHFGSGVVVPGMGILLNNELDDFTLDAAHINRPAPGKIPRSNMAPTIVFRRGEPVASIGTPGGGRIPGTLVQILVRKIDFGESLDEAIEAPRLFVNTGKRRVAYESRISKSLLEAAVALLGDEAPFALEPRERVDRYFGGAQGIWREGDVLEGGADSRRDGVALGMEESKVEHRK